MTLASASQRWSRARGYVMPLVVLLVFVGSLVSAVMIERQASVRLSVQRRLDGYDSHHLGRGVAEVVSAWLETVRGERLTDRLEEGGHALDIRVEDGTTLKIYMEDAQGAALDVSLGLAEDIDEDAIGVFEALRAIGGDPMPEDWLRPVGPSTVCAASAPREVLEAVLEYATEGEGADGVLAEILSVRNDRDGLTNQELTTAIGGGGFESAVRSRVQGLLVAEPELWRVRVERHPSRVDLALRRGEVVVYEGYAFLSRQSSGGVSALLPWHVFLTWERVEESE